MEMQLFAFFKKNLKNKVSFFFQKAFSVKTSLSARYLSNGLVQCSWTLNKVDKAKLFKKGVFSLAIRIFDITAGTSKENSTCIMKEIEVNRKLSKCFIQPPISNGTMLIEIGYRAFRSNWEKFSNYELKLGEREVIILSPDEPWFDLPFKEFQENLHEKIYRISSRKNLGGSEKLHSLEELNLK